MSLIFKLRNGKKTRSYYRNLNLEILRINRRKRTACEQLHKIFCVWYGHFIENEKSQYLDPINSMNKAAPEEAIEFLYNLRQMENTDMKTDSSIDLNFIIGASHPSSLINRLYYRNIFNSINNATYNKSHLFNVVSRVFNNKSDIVNVFKQDGYKELCEESFFEQEQQDNDSDVVLIKPAPSKDDFESYVYLHFFPSDETDEKIVCKIHVCCCETEKVHMENNLLKNIFQISQKNERNTSNVYMIAQDSSGLTYKSIGSNFVAIERFNYNDAVLKDYDYIVSQFSQKESDGFITILNGPPGTGKSYLIRAFMNDLKNCLFLYIPPYMFSNLNSPSFITLLSEMSEENADKKIVIILEDADEVLAPRMSDNIAHISTLLNMTDGILGRLLNLHIIATTNQPKANFDDAILRPGRLLCKSFVGAVSTEKARQIFAREAKTESKHPDLEIFGSVPIAEVYHAAKEFLRTGDFIKMKVSSNKIGF